MSIEVSYSNYDKEVANRKLYDNLFRYNPSVNGSELQLADGGTYDKSAADYAIEQAIAGHTSEHIKMIEQIFVSKIQDYQDDTVKQVLYNDLANTNKFITDNVDREHNKLNSMRDKTYNAVYKTKQMYMLKKYEVAYNNFSKNVIQFTIFVVIICSLIMGASYDPNISLNQTFAIAVVSVILAIYLLIMALFVRKTMLRRKDDWNKFYFSSMNSNKSSCGS